MRKNNASLFRLIKKSSKDQLVKLAGSKERCSHGHTIFEHPNCFDLNRGERVGVIDIETDHLKADFGTTLCYVIKELDKPNYYTRVITQAETMKVNDKRVVEGCIEDMRRFDRLIGYYHTGFDIPFLRARASINELEFPPYGSIYVDDLYYIIRKNFSLSSKGLENACRQLLGISNKTKLDGKIWKSASRGDDVSMGYILDHCMKDVEDTEKLYHHIKDFYKPVRKSL